MKNEKILKYTLIPLLVFSIIALFSGYYAIKHTNNEIKESIFNPKLKTTKQQPKRKLSKYKRILKELEEDETPKLFYKIKIKKENPFFSFTKRKIEEKKQIQEKPKRKKNKKNKIKKGIISHKVNEAENEFYEARIEKTQIIKNGKPIKLILKEAIPSLDLEAETELRGIARLIGSRIMIKITSYLEKGRLKRINLKCFDKADCLEGIYHEDLAKEIEDDLKEETIDEVLDINFTGNKIAKRGNKILRKRMKKMNITLLKGKELLISPEIVK